MLCLLANTYAVPPLVTADPNCLKLADRTDAKGNLDKWCFELRNKDGCDGFYTKSSKGVRLCSSSGDRPNKRCQAGELFTCPLPPSPPACDTSACNGASGISAIMCHEAKTIECCIANGSSEEKCCSEASPQMFSGPAGLTPCKALQPPSPPPSPPAQPTCDISGCNGCSGEQCQYCHEAKTIQCCINEGESKDTCCADASPHMLSGPAGLTPCKAPSPPSPPSPPSTCDMSDCIGCSGEQCQYCREAKTIQCCINNGGSKDTCCAEASPQMFSGPAGLTPCKAPSPPSTQCAALAQRQDVKVAKDKWCTELTLRDAGDGGCEAWSTTTRKGSRLCVPPTDDSVRCRVTALFQCPGSP